MKKRIVIYLLACCCCIAGNFPAANIVSYASVAEERASAIKLTVDKKQSGHLAHSGDKMYYVFETSGISDVTVTFTNPIQQGSSLYWRVRLMDRQEKALDTKYVGGNTKKTILEGKSLPAGTYYVLVSCVSSYSPDIFSVMFHSDAALNSGTQDEEQSSEQPTAGSQRGDQIDSSESGNSQADSSQNQSDTDMDSDEDEDVPDAQEIGDVTKISFDNPNVAMTKDNTIALVFHVSLKDDSMDYPEPEVVSEDEDKVEIGNIEDPENGIGTVEISAMEIGTTTITLKAGGQKAACKVSVSPVSAQLTKVLGAGKKLGIKWKRPEAKSGVTGYQIEYAMSKNMSNSKNMLVKGRKSSAYTVNNLKAGKTYYVRIRTYATSESEGKRYYSSWSKIKSAKVSK